MPRPRDKNMRAFSVPVKVLSSVLCLLLSLSCAFAFTPASKEGVDTEISKTVLPEDLNESTFPVGEKHRKTWTEFYTASSESANISVLVKAGPSIVPEIASAIADKKMYKRRYAILALGYLEEKSVIPALQAILNNPTEKDYFRGDALEAIYILDQSVGRLTAQRLVTETQTKKDDYLLRTAKRILESPNTIKPKWTEYHGP